MAELSVGKKAPAFTLKDAEGNKLSLSKDILGQRAVVYFYPKDNTPGCTKQACSLRDNMAALRRRKIKVVGISPDGAESHEKFTAKYDLNFTLLSDPDHKVAEKYGAWGEKNLYGKKSFGIKRSTFLIGADGKIEHIWKRPDTKRHGEEVLEKIEELKAAKK